MTRWFNTAGPCQDDIHYILSVANQPIARFKAVREQRSYFVVSTEKSKIRIAIAWDSAFNFYYPDNLDILVLENLGAELVDWSPVHDTVPANIQGLYFGSGFPEVFAEELALLYWHGYQKK